MVEQGETQMARTESWKEEWNSERDGWVEQEDRLLRRKGIRRDGGNSARSIVGN